MQLAANVTSSDVLDWQAIDWKRVYRTIKNLRQRIFRASREGDLKKVRSLQRLMLRCRANVMESVRRVTQVNHGRYTPGVDKVLVKTPEERAALCQKLSQLELHKVHPVRRIYIPKKKGQRPLGIPGIADRCIQAMVKNALEPYWEARFEGISCRCLILSEALLALIRFFLPTINDPIRQALLTLFDSIIPLAHIQ